MYRCVEVLEVAKHDYCVLANVLLMCSSINRKDDRATAKKWSEEHKVMLRARFLRVTL